MKKMLAILACNIVNKISKLFGKKGTVIGGQIALKIDKNILKKIKYPKYVIGVSGSTGKGSTTELIAGLLKYTNITYAYNEEGSNAINGITSLIIRNSNIKGKFQKEVLLMELDEKHSVNILKNFDLTHYVVTNITRDQPPRNAHPDYIFNEMKKNVKDNVKLILNADDPIVYKLNINHKDSLFYGCNKNNYSISTDLNYRDAAYCPICGSKLKYDYYHYGHLGKYTCPNNDFNRPNLDVHADELNVENKCIKINNNKIIMKNNLLYTVYSYLGCYSLGKSIGISDETIVKYFDSIKDTKNPDIFTLKDRTWHILLSKNETNLSYKQSIDYIKHEHGIKTIIMGFDNCSRRYSENDVSWLWDIDFEELNDEEIDKIIIVGKFKYNVLNRLLYAGINRDKCILINSYENDMLDAVYNQTKGNIYPMVYFDKAAIIRDILKREVEKNEN